MDWAPFSDNSIGNVVFDTLFQCDWFCSERKFCEYIQIGASLDQDFLG